MHSPHPVAPLITLALGTALLVGCAGDEPMPTELLAPDAALAAAAEVSTSPILTFAGMKEVGQSGLVRTDNGVSFRLTTTELEPGAVHTLWMVIFNNPSACSLPGCGIDDLANLAAVVDAVYSAGTVVGESGRATLAGHRSEDDASGSILGEWLGLPTPGLMDATAAEIHFVVHSHGPKIPGLVSEMLHTFNAGCGPIFEPGLPPVPETLGTYGPNTCADVQFAVHLP